MLCIGEQLGQDSSEITGVVVAKRKAGTKLAVWTKFQDREAVVNRIGYVNTCVVIVVCLYMPSVYYVIKQYFNYRKFFKEICNIPAEFKIGYQCHDEAIKSSTSFANDSKYTI